MSIPARVAIIDDHPMIRRGVAMTFDDEADFDVVAQGGSAQEAIDIVREYKPDLVVLDVSIPGGGLEAASALMKDNPKTALLMLSVSEDLGTVKAALRAGARAFVSKGTGGTELVRAARQVLAGERYVSSELAARLLSIDELANGAAARSEVDFGRLSTLSTREQQILELLGEGLSNNDIAGRLELTENTIKHYITSLLQKLGVRNRTEAALLTQKSKR
ncbi:MAG: response regulator transcription factor [Hyphomicrobiaceae bacterium]